MLLAKYYFGERIKEDEIKDTCSMYGTDDENHSLDLGIDGRVILRWILRK
jgi:hypothetical protein